MKRDRSVVRGAIAGAAAGIVGSLAMSGLSLLWTRIRRADSSREETLVQQGGRPDVESAKKEGRTSGEPAAVATTAVAERVAEAVLRRPLSPEGRHKGGMLVHYAFGAAAGAVYGAGTELVPQLKTGVGIPFGLSVWAGGIPLALPALRLAAPAHHYTLGEHAFGVACHIVYGLVSEITRHKVRSWLRDSASR